MSKKLKVIGLALVVVCAFGAVSASASAAIHWNVGGKTISATTAVAENVTLEKFEAEEATPSSTLTVSGLLRIVCSKLSIQSGNLLVSSTDEAKSLTFSGCSVKTTKGESTTCTVKSSGGTLGSIVTTANKSALKEVSGKAYDVFTPASGTTFATLEIAPESGKSCALSGTNTVTGTAALELPVGTNATTLQGTASAAIATAAGTELKYGARTAVLDGKGSLALAGGSTWGVGL